MARLFVSVTPPSAVRDHLVGDLLRPEQPGVRWVPPEQWHVTLRFLGDAAAGEVLERLDGCDLPAAIARLGPMVSRFGRDTVVVPVAGLDELAATVVAATADVGAPPDPRPFRGHLTIARLRHRAACGVTGTRVVADFAVSEIELVSSTLLPSGAEHSVLARWPVPR